MPASQLATHGKKAKIWIARPSAPDTLIEFTGRAYNIRQAFARDLAESSTFGIGDKEFTAGMRGATMSLDVRQNDDIDQLLFECYSSDEPVKVRYAPEGNATGKRYYEGYFLLENYEPGSNIGENNNGSTNFTRTAGSNRGTF
jgi:hypothetical protein